MKTAVTVLTLAAAAMSTEFTVGTKIEPLFQIRENGSFADSSKSSSELHRAQISMEAKKRTESGIQFRGELTLDATEKSTEKMIHEGSVSK